MIHRKKMHTYIAFLCLFLTLLVGACDNPQSEGKSGPSKNKEEGEAVKPPDNCKGKNEVAKLILVAEIKKAVNAAEGSGKIDLNHIDTSAITDMCYLFSSKRKGYGLGAVNVDISGWDVSQVTDMRQMFHGASTFNGDISEWKVSNVTTMYGMFWGATAFNGDI